MTFDELQTALIAAMKEKNRVKKTVIADIVACTKNMAIEQGCKDNITEEITTAAILKSKKICQEQIDSCPANRPDLLENFQLCMTYINEFAPKMMTREEVYHEFSEIISNWDAEIPINKGTLMKKAMSKLKGKADGKLINEIAHLFLMKLTL